MCSLFASLLFLLALPALSQPVTIKKVAVIGAPAYQPAALINATGMQPGVSTGDQIRTGAQRLNDTGLFSNIAFKFDGETLTYTLTPAAQLLSARFDNFVWWSPAELDQMLRSRLPLYNGKVPQQGAFAASIADALTHMLAEKSVTATVTFLSEASGNTKSFSSIIFQVSTPAVKIGSVAVQGAPTALAEKLATALKEAGNQIYSETTSREYVATAIANVAFENGYMEEQLTGFQHRTPVVNGDQVSVDAVATIEPGLQYHVSNVVWAGSPLLSKQDFAKLNPLKPGSIASKQELTHGLQSLGGYYYRSGYMNAKLHAEAAFDRPKATVAYTVTVTPGEQFHLNTVKFYKLSAVQEAAVQKAWTMHPGDLYDTTYVTTFMQKNRQALSGVLGNYGANYKATADHDAHTVELEVSFAPLTLGQ